MKGLRNENQVLQIKIKRLEAKAAAALENGSVSLDEETSLDMKKILEDENRNIGARYPEDSFQFIFWKQQREYLPKKGKNGIRWHPLMIKRCLYLRHQSVE